MKNIYLLILSGFMFLNAQAQDQKYWSSEKLQFSDFEGSPAGGVPMQIKYDIAYSTKRQKVEQTHHAHYQARAIFIPSQSWIVFDGQRDLRLRYCNVVFDFVELYARRFEDEINVTDNISQSKNQTIQALNDAVSQLSADTKMGTDEKRVAFWEHHIDSVLSYTFRKEIPDYKYDRLTLGYYWGAAYNHLTGNLGAQFSSPVSISNGIYLNWKRVMYSVHATFLGSSKPSQSYYSNKQEFGDTARFYMSYGTFSIGYNLVRQPQFVLTPYAGISAMRMSLRDYDDVQIKKYTNPLRASVNAGLALDFRSKAFYQNNSIQFRYGLTMRANYSPYNYLPKLQGNCLSFSLGLSLYMDAVKNYL